ncbi:MAG: phosphohistidine phosphatase [Gaiellaceae bacterium]|nr:phosphohistidine phosphatase [Gaiellaceae bacterium]
MRLYLIRHADSASGEPDELRRLTPGGEAQSRELGERLAGRLPPELVLSSPLLRARQTADAIARAAGCPSEVDERLAPGATVEGLLAAIEGRGETVVVVGHQPDCGEIALALTGEARPFPPAGLAVIDLPAQ